jgi:protein-L-isoaspartate(D-aspartate) O-methyltransferase
MNFNYAKARKLMVENQLRPNKIKDPVILNIFKNIPKENFIPKEMSSISYSDIDISLGSNRGYLKNLHIAQLISHAELSKKHKILHLGALTGYVTEILANLCLKVYAIETDERLNIILNNNIKNINSNNIEIVNGSFKFGYKYKAPFDRIFIDSTVKKIDNEILDQLSNDSGKIIFIERTNKYISKAFKTTKNNNNYSKKYLFDVFTTYELFNQKEGFKF